MQLHFLKAVLCGCIGKIIFSGFIPTMQFIEKQHNVTLKALILSSIYFSLFRYYFPLEMNRTLYLKKFESPLPKDDLC